MSYLIWGVLLPGCFLAAWWVIRRPVRLLIEEMHVDHARTLFKQQREWLEARFLGALGRSNPAERLRWEDARWHDDIHWARDRKSRGLLALVGVHFDVTAEPSAFDDDHAMFETGTDLLFEEDLPAPAPVVARQHATALFEFRKGRWVADGKRLDDTRPDEAFLRNQRFEPVAPPAPRY